MQKTQIPNLAPGQRHPNWIFLYEKAREEALPWYTGSLDPDFEKVLAKERAPSRKNLLDIGAGLGTQSAYIGKMGFRVTGTEISPAAVTRAREKYPQVMFVVDDIRTTGLNSKFDYIIDRGCFHVLDVAEHPAYLRSMRKLIQPGGIFLLKVFSSEMRTTDFGPLRFSMPALHHIFNAHFEIIQMKRTQFYCATGNHIPSWFLILKGRADV